MHFWPLDSPIECDAAFREAFHRPPPWFELARTDTLEELAWTLSTRLGMQPPTINLKKVSHAAAERILRTVQPHPAYRGDTEPVSSAVPRLGVPTDGAVWLWRGDESAARMRLRDLLEFESLLWRDESWLIDEHAEWLLYGPHERECGWLDLIRRSGARH